MIVGLILFSIFSSNLNAHAQHNFSTFVDDTNFNDGDQQNKQKSFTAEWRNFKIGTTETL